MKKIANIFLGILQWLFFIIGIWQFIGVLPALQLYEKAKTMGPSIAQIEDNWWILVVIKLIFGVACIALAYGLNALRNRKFKKSNVE